MKIHILGICGTFMGGVAAIARELGHEVSGSDQNVYPPMSDTLNNLGITLMQGYRAEHVQPHPDLVIIGNALSRGNPAIEYVLDQQIPYLSGPQWLAEAVLHKRHVLAVSGTHGKTTTSSMLTWILEYAGLNPGYLIGGVAKNFDTTARLGSDYFVIEADEYDTAFFDKRSKFLHYRPRTLIMNNLEFDHADIFADLNAIKRQFELLLRCVPAQGCVIRHSHDSNLQEVVERGCWSRQTVFDDIPIALEDANSIFKCDKSELGVPGGERYLPRVASVDSLHAPPSESEYHSPKSRILNGEWYSVAWHARHSNKDATQFDVYCADRYHGQISWNMFGRHNRANALAAIAAAADVGVDPAKACEALSCFAGIKRRLEVRGVVKGVTVYDDFAHHPTAIRETLMALRRRVGQQRIIAVLQFGSNTMKQGEHAAQIAPALADADQVIFLEPENFSLDSICATLGPSALSFADVDKIIQQLVEHVMPCDHVLIMSNKGFGGIHDKLLASLR